MRIDAGPVLADLARDPFDLAIREGGGVYPEAESVCLFALEFLPGGESRVRQACSRVAPAPSTGRKARLLHEVSFDYWPDWCAMAGEADVDVARGLFFSHTMLALDAAIDGQGVALAPRMLAERELARGTLLILDPRSFVSGTGIYLAWARRALRTLSPAAVAFRDWLIEEAKSAAAPATTCAAGRGDAGPDRSPRGRATESALLRVLCVCEWAVAAGGRSGVIDRFRPQLVGPAPLAPSLSLPWRARTSLECLP